ncbi:MAG TPA: hypothetical protein DCE18_05770 [Syntrophobacteraceae bacterium]|nr:hypothetical protein [Syntrophobacteraceae bacterium]
MARFGRVVSVLLWLLVGVGCAITQLESESFVDPAAPPRTFHRILAMAKISEYTNRVQAEQAFVERLTRGSTQVLTSASLMLPDKKYTEAEINALIRQHQIDAVLLITMTAEYQQQIQTAGSPSCTTALASANAALLESRECSIDNFIHRPTVEFHFRFYDVATNQTVWEAASVTQGTNLSGFPTLIRSLADTTAQRMLRENVVQ